MEKEESIYTNPARVWGRIMRTRTRARLLYEKENYLKKCIVFYKRVKRA